MNEADAIKWVQNHSDSDKIDESELEAAFAAIFGRMPDEEDQELGLWSLCCATC